MTALEQAIATRTKLESKLFDAKNALTELDRTRAAISFSAHTGGDGAKAALNKMNRDRSERVAEIETIESALAEAERRIDAAEAAEEAAALSERAARALEIGASLLARGAKIDEALAAVAEEARAMQAELHELQVLGLSHPNSHQLNSLGERAVCTALMSTPIKLRHLAPGERYSFAEITAGFAAQIDRWASARLPEAAE